MPLGSQFDILGMDPRGLHASKVNRGFRPMTKRTRRMSDQSKTRLGPEKTPVWQVLLFGE
jgi:hypothetical protein